MKATSLNRKIKKFSEEERLYFNRKRLTNEQYHLCHKAVSSSALKEFHFGKNPSFCYQKYIKKTVPHAPSDAMIIGSATHKLILEPKDFNKEFAVFDGRKAGKVWTEFKEQHQGVDIITKAVYDDISAMRDAVMKNPEANKLLSGGTAEDSVFWRDKETSVLCRARSDYQKMVGSSKILVDLKTCKTAEPINFTKDLINLGYFLQQAMYMDGFNAQAFAFVAVEKSSNTVQVYTLDDMFQEAGHLLYREALEKWAECLQNKNWPTYAEGVTELVPPTWWLNKVMAYE